MKDRREKIAVLGAGVSGIVSAYLLQDSFQVTLYEKNDYLGGHTNTVVIPDGPDKGTPVDTGFIVLNNKNYPLFHRFLARLDVPVRWSEMSFSYYSERDSYYYAGNNLFGLFACPGSSLKLTHWKFLWGIVSFCRRSLDELDRGISAEESLEDYLKRIHCPERVVRQYVLPMAAAIWSAPQGTMLEFPAKHFLLFFRNHGLLTLNNRPRWQTVVGGSFSYVKKFRESFKGEVKLNSAVTSVERYAEGVMVRTRDSKGDMGEELFDKVVIALHADRALRVLKDPSELEQRLLGAWTYEKNKVSLHTDTKQIAPNKKAWSSWNYLERKDANIKEPATLSYHMNTLQGLKTEKDYFVSLNTAVSKEFVIAEFDYEHPVYTAKSMASQLELPLLNMPREKQTFFCGSYFGYGFHEDAVRSAVDLASLLGSEL